MFSFFFSFLKSGDHVAHTTSTLYAKLVHSGSVSWENCGMWSLMSCMWTRFPDRFPHCAWTAVSLLRLHWVKGVYMFRCNLPPALLAAWPEVFYMSLRKHGVEQIPNKGQHRKLTPEKKILPWLLLGFELTNFSSQARRSTNAMSKTGWLKHKTSLQCLK